MLQLSIGRTAENKIVLNDSFVSRQHAELIFMDNGQVLLKDLGSSNGTFVNGNKVIEYYLRVGDTVKCAAVVLNWQQYMPVKNRAENTVTAKPVAAEPVYSTAPMQEQRFAPEHVFSVAAPVAAAPAPQVAVPGYIAPHSPMQQNVIIVGKAKSVGVAFLLAFFFGPLGLLYSTVTGGIVMFIINIIVAIFTLGFGLLLTWPICCIWAIIAANNANAALRNSVGSYANNNY
jgi:hypothetical protein